MVAQIGMYSEYLWAADWPELPQQCIPDISVPRASRKGLGYWQVRFEGVCVSQSSKSSKLPEHGTCKACLWVFKYELHADSQFGDQRILPLADEVPQRHVQTLPKSISLSIHMQHP